MAGSHEKAREKGEKNWTLFLRGLDKGRNRIFLKSRRKFETLGIRPSICLSQGTGILSFVLSGEREYTPNGGLTDLGLAKKDLERKEQYARGFTPRDSGHGVRDLGGTGWTLGFFLYDPSARPGGVPE